MLGSAIARLQGYVRGPFAACHRALSWDQYGHVNPLNHIGALMIYCLWIVLVSGLWITAWFDTSLAGAYASVEAMSDQWYLAGVMRSLHRYASDALVLLALLHLTKEFAYGRYRGPRWVAWTTGVLVFALVVLPLGITGYWLVWDRLAHFIALRSAEFLDGLPWFSDAMARNFVSASSVSDRFFTFMAFAHLIGLPLILVIGIWLHLARLPRPALHPPRALMALTLAMLLVVSLLEPARSQGAADPGHVGFEIGLDWFYLFGYPVLESGTPRMLWTASVLVVLFLLVLPWLARGDRRPSAVVHLPWCNGCGRCVDDCPFGAITLGPRSDGSRYAREAVVDPDLCVACGVCVGACPTATPFRTRAPLLPGIDLPDVTLAALREAVLAAAAHASDVVFCCADRPPSRAGGRPAIVVPCVGQIPPSMFDFALERAGATSIRVEGCADECRYRFGRQWTEARIARKRDPYLRQRVDRARIQLTWHRAGNSRLRHFAGKAGVIGFLALVAVAIAQLSQRPRLDLLAADEAMVVLAFSATGSRVQPCRTRTADELAALPPTLRIAGDCPRARHPVVVEFVVDDRRYLSETLLATGLAEDGEVNLYRRWTLAAGERGLSMRLSVDGGASFAHQRSWRQALSPGEAVVVTFDAQSGAIEVE